MPEWVTHMMVADTVLEQFPQLDRHGFYVGNVAPDCNIQNEDWTEFTPPRAVTHWMQGQRKTVDDVDAFCEKYIISRREEILAREKKYEKNSDINLGEEYSFLLGYYVHLITDAVFQEMIRDEKRVAKTWERIKADRDMMERLNTLASRLSQIDSDGNPVVEENWDTVKMLIPRDERLKEFQSLEAEYLQTHPDCGYFTDIMPLKEFPDYLDYLPHGSIAFKIPYLGSYIPEIYEEAKFIGWSREEFDEFLDRTWNLVATKFHEKDLV